VSPPKPESKMPMGASGSPAGTATKATGKGPRWHVDATEVT
jgi:hypothetical protein